MKLGVSEDQIQTPVFIDEMDAPFCSFAPGIVFAGVPYQGSIKYLIVILTQLRGQL